MKHPYATALSIDSTKTARRNTRTGQTDWQLYYEIGDQAALQMIAGSSLLPPHLLITTSEESARELGITLLESEYPESGGWRNHRVSVVDIESDFLLYEQAQQFPVYASLNLYIVSGIVMMRFGSALMNRLTIVGTCPGNSESEAFRNFKERYLDRSFPSDFRVGFAAKIRPVRPEVIRFWRRESLKPILATAESG